VGKGVTGLSKPRDQTQQAMGEQKITSFTQQNLPKPQGLGAQGT